MIARLISLSILSATSLAWGQSDGLPTGGTLEGFVDGVLARELAAGTMVGATVAIVKDGRIALAKGYGMADLAAQRRVHGEHTLFRVGSLSKALVWIAVAQQVQAGQISLDDDVSAKLSDLQIPQNYPDSIRVEHLLNHSAGFEERLVGLFATGPRTVGTFHERLASMRPERVDHPGRRAVYSNYGTALAARLVEQASGMDWDRYVESHILDPLGMSRTSTLQPPPEALFESVAQGYRLTAEGPVRVGFEYMTLAPIGSVSSTAGDMARLMIELLRTDDTAVLQGRGRRLLARPGIANDERVNRMLFGFYQRDTHGQRIVGQHGEMLGFRSELMLYPELGLGVFVSFNADRSRAPRLFAAALNDWLFGRQWIEGEAPGERGQAFEGVYASLRAPQSTGGKLYRYADTIAVSVDADGWMQMSGVSPTGTVSRLVELEPEVFAARDGSTRAAFSVAPDGTMQLVLGSRPYLVYERLPQWLLPNVQLGGLAVGGLLLLGVLIWPLSALRQMGLGRALVPGERLASTVGLTSAALLVFFFVQLIEVMRTPGVMAFGWPESLTTAMWLPVVAAPLVLLQLVWVLRAWGRSYWWLSRRIHFTLLTLAQALLIAWCGFWNLTAITPAMLMSWVG